MGVGGLVDYGVGEADLEEAGELGGGDWLAEEVALAFLAGLGLQVGALGLGLDAFGDDQVL